MTRRLFIAGTDTEIGKTYVSCGLLRLAKQSGLTTIGFKPVASGCEVIDNALMNSDALQLQQHATQPLAYDLVNPIAFQPAVAPHIIAAQQQTPLSVTTLCEISAPTLAMPADLHIIEGFGGWLAPLNAKETMADYVAAMQLDVILVVGIRLGCINHALLTAESMQSHHVNCVGWIANCIDPEMAYAQENIDMVSTRLPFPLLDVVAFGGGVSLS